MQSFVSKELTIEAAIENIRVVTDFADEQLATLGCPLKARMQIDIAIDELFSNIAQYAYSPETGDVTIRVDAAKEPPAVLISFIDCGKPYNPLAKEDPDIALSAEEREIGGLGIFMVKEIMDEMRYQYKDGQNILTIRKNIG